MLAPVDLVEEAGPQPVGVDVRDARAGARTTSCSLLISRLKTPTLLRSLTAACSAMLSAKLVLPTDGRAARMMRSLRWSPVEQRVEVVEARADPADLAAVGVQVLEPVVRLVEQRRQGLEARRDALLADLEQVRFRPVDGLLDRRRGPRSRCPRCARRRRSGSAARPCARRSGRTARRGPRSGSVGEAER